MATEVRRDSMKSIAQSAGVSLSDASADAIAAIVEKRMNDLIADARKFMRHSYRSALSTADVNAALRLRNMESVLGYSGSDALAFRRVAVAPVAVLQSTSSTSDMYYLDDRPIQLDAYLAAPLLAAGRSAPCDPNFSVHWLAIEGVQPRVPQNPLPPIDTTELELTSLADRDVADASTANSAADGSAAAKRRRIAGAADASAAVASNVVPLTKHLLSKEQQLYFENICSVLRAAATAALDAASAAPSSLATAAAAAADAVVLQRAVLRSLSTDAGVQPLVPFLTRFVAEEVAGNLHSLPRLHASLRVAEALLRSPHAFLEPYLHQLVPALLTCVLGRRLCAHAAEDHWALRQRAARLVAEVCSRFGLAHRTLQARIVRQLLSALCDPQKALTAHYGALVTLGAMGVHVVRAALVPCAPLYLALLAPEMEPDAHQAALAATAAAASRAAHAPSAPSVAATTGAKSVATAPAAAKGKSATKAKAASTPRGGKSAAPASAASARATVVSSTGMPAHWAAAAKSGRVALATHADDDDDNVFSTSLPLFASSSSSASSASSLSVFPAHSAVVFRAASVPALAAPAASAAPPAANGAHTETASASATAERRLEVLQCHGALLSVYGAYVRHEIENEGFVSALVASPPEFIQQKASDAVGAGGSADLSPMSYFVEALVPFVEASRRSMLSQLFL